MLLSSFPVPQDSTVYRVGSVEKTYGLKGLFIYKYLGINKDFKLSEVI